jgi:hypothetical protein
MELMLSVAGSGHTLSLGVRPRAPKHRRFRAAAKLGIVKCFVMGLCLSACADSAETKAERDPTDSNPPGRPRDSMVVDVDVEVEAGSPQDAGIADAGPMPTDSAVDAQPPCEVRVSGLTLIDLEDPELMDVAETPTLNGGCYDGKVEFTFTPDDCGPQFGPPEKYRVSTMSSSQLDSIVERFGNRGTCPPGDGSTADDSTTPTFGLIIQIAGPRELILRVELVVDQATSSEAEFRYLIP